MSNQAAISCLLCGQERLGLVLSVTTDRTYRVLRCSRCQFAFSVPRPSPQELATFYSATYFTRDRDTNLGYADYRSIAEANAKHMWSVLPSYVNGGLGSPGRILDVGCATGGFLGEAQNAGWDCVGLELSREAAAAARQSVRRVIQGDLSAPELLGETFQVVTMWHVLEHLIDPVAALKRVRELVAPGGILFLELPNWNSLGRLIRRERWSQLKPPEHINFFTPESLRAALDACGFTVQQCDTHYPSIQNEARMARWNRPLFQVAGMAAALAAAAGAGGYLRAVAVPGSSSAS